MNQPEDLPRLLESGGYRAQSAYAGATVVEFEDEAVIGFAVFYESVDDLLEQWKIHHDTYLRSRVREIRAAADKISNLYSIYLTRNAAKREQLAEIQAIEENFVGSRKIVGVNVRTREDLRVVLLPLLPVQSTTKLLAADLESRLNSRLSSRPGLYSLLVAAKTAEDLISGVLDE